MTEHQPTYVEPIMTKAAEPKPEQTKSSAGFAALAAGLGIAVVIFRRK